MKIIRRVYLKMDNKEYNIRRWKKHQEYISVGFRLVSKKYKHSYYTARYIKIIEDKEETKPTEIDYTNPLAQLLV